MTRFKEKEMLRFSGIKLRLRRKIFGRSGIAGFPLLIFTAFFAAISISFVSLRFSGTEIDSARQGFVQKTSAIVLKTLGGIFAGEEKKPVFEIGLADNQGSGATPPENKNAAAAPKKIAEQKISGAEEKNIPAQKTGGEILPPVPAKIAEEKISECAFSKSGTANHKIIFSEINWVGSKESASDEWMEIKNNSGENISLAGWQILSGDGNIKIIFDAGDKISSGNLYLLERTGDDSVLSVAADKIYSGALSNSGAYLKIFGPDCSISDEIDASKKWPAGDATNRKTMERSIVDFSWHTSASLNGTPKTENTAAFSKKEPETDVQNEIPETNQPTAPAPTTSQTQSQNTPHILIAEIQISGSSADNDFIRIFNAGNSTADIGGWKLRKRNVSGTESSLGVFPSGSSINGGGYFLWANSENGFAQSIGANVSNKYYISGNNSAALFDKSGKIIDAVAWGSGQSNSFAEGTPYPANPEANRILHRKSSGGIFQDTDNNQNDFEIK